MGKKKIVQQTSEEAAREIDQIASAIKKAEQQSSTRKISEGRIYISASYNNTMITVTDGGGNMLAWSSAGSLGFRGPKKSTPFAASKVADAVAEKLRKTMPMRVQVFVRGIGSGRDSAIRTLANRGFEVVAIQDVTPIPHNGPKPRKPRRI